LRAVRAERERKTSKQTSGRGLKRPQRHARVRIARERAATDARVRACVRYSHGRPRARARAYAAVIVEWLALLDASFHKDRFFFSFFLLFFFPPFSRRSYSARAGPSIKITVSATALANAPHPGSRSVTIWEFNTAMCRGRGDGRRG